MGDVVALRKDGSTFPVQVSASMVLDESDRPICMMGSFLDITKQKMAEELMIRAEKLLQNAIHAVSGRGTITLESRFVKSNNLVEVTVTDDGPGIPEEHRKKVFDPFLTTKPVGTGLGLSICHSIIEQHMGTIRVEPVEDGGVCVCVRLPASGEEKRENAG